MGRPRPCQGIPLIYWERRKRHRRSLRRPGIKVVILWGSLHKLTAPGRVQELWRRWAFCPCRLAVVCHSEWRKMWRKAVFSGPHSPFSKLNPKKKKKKHTSVSNSHLWMTYMWWWWSLTLCVVCVVMAKLKKKKGRDANLSARLWHFQSYVSIALS